MVLLATILVLVVIGVVYLLQPLPQLLYLKYKYGSRAVIWFYPLHGFFRFLSKSQKQNGDPFFIVKDLVAKQPNLDFVFSNLGFKPVIYLLKPSYYKEMMINYHNYEKNQMVPDTRLVKKGMILEKGAKWKQQKNILGHHFRFEQLINRIPMMNVVIGQKIQDVKLYDDIFPSIKICSSITGEIVLRSFFGDDIAKLNFNGSDPANAVIAILSNMGGLVRDSMYFFAKWIFLGDKAWSTMPTKREREVYDYNTLMLDHMREIVSARIKQKQSNDQTKTSDDFLDIYLEQYLTQTKDSLEITEDEIVQQCLTLFFAGTETTANLVATSIYYLAERQDLQQEILEEIHNVLGDSKVVEHRHLSELIKTTGFLMECLRLVPVAPSVVARRALTSHYIKDIMINKGWFTNIFMVATSMNTNYFEKPYEIDYKRWQVDGKLSSTQSDSFAFVPFSAGGRNCIGQHMALIESKIMICYFLRKFKFIRNIEFPTANWEYRITYGLLQDNYVKWVAR